MYHSAVTRKEQLSSGDSEGIPETSGRRPVKRACYASDRTGRVIMDTLYDHCMVRGVKIFNEVFVTSLLMSDGRCCGVSGYELATS